MDSPSQSADSAAAPSILAHPTLRRWWLRARIAAVAFTGWWIMRHWADVWIVPIGFERPLVLFASEGGIGGGLAAGAILLAIGWAGAQLAWNRSGSAPLVIICLILAAWATRGGVMDDWLAIQNPKPGHGTAGPYLALLPDYVLLAALLFSAAWLGGYVGRPVAATGAARWRGLLGLDQTARDRAVVLKGVAAGALAAAAVLFVACGPPRGETLRGQVYFAMYVAGYVGALVAGRVSDGPHDPKRRQTIQPADRTPALYLAIPCAVGLAGVLLASARPVLSPPFELINTIPPWWGLARPLPAEAASVGVLGVLHGLVTLRRWDARHAAGHA